MMQHMIDWSELENQIGLESLPAFHRAFLVSRGVDVTGMKENAEAGKKGGKIAKNARLELEQKNWQARGDG